MKTYLSRHLIEGNLQRRRFLQAGTSILITATLAGPALRHALVGNPLYAENPKPDFRQGSRNLVIRPVLIHDRPQRVESKSWRNWTGLQTPESVDRESSRIAEELVQLQEGLDFGTTVLPLERVSSASEVEKLDQKAADVVLVYAAGGWTDTLDRVVGLGKHAILFLRHHSGPYYLWDEIVSSRFLRQHSDHLKHPQVDVMDVVVDDPQELVWRLRALYGLINTMGQPIVCVGGPGGWATPNAPELARDRFALEMISIEIPEIEERIRTGRENPALMDRCRQEATRYIHSGLTTLETTTQAVTEAFLLQSLFVDLMTEHKTHAVTVRGCMNSYAGIMPCMTLTLVNDSGKMAYCEGDFVVIPSGILMHFVSGKPTYFCNPSFPRGNKMMFAHCTAPRMMDGQSLAPVRLTTHYESDWGAATHVEFRVNQKVTVIKPDFEAKHWMATTGTIVDTPYLDTCRAQVELALDADPRELKESLRGFHCMLAYGDYTHEIEYAAKKVGIRVQILKNRV